MKAPATPAGKAIYDAGLALGWLYPFFALPLGKIKRYVEDPRIPTAGITLDGVVRYNPDFVLNCDRNELQFVVAHEISHLLLGHHTRRQGRDFEKWNRAADRAINIRLKHAEMKLFDWVLLPESGQEDWPAERLYEEEEDPPQKGGSGDGDGQPRVGEGCGISDPEDRDGEGEAGVDRDEDLEREWREVAIQAATMAKQIGRGHGKILADLVDIPKPKVKWSSILRKGIALARAAQGCDSTTWSRRGRRSSPVGPQFPGWIGARPSLAVVIDTSGSMSDDELKQCVAETIAAASASGESIYLVTHDDGVQWEGWLSSKMKVEDVKTAIKGRGGTCAREAYEKVEAAARRFDVMIHLTDCGLQWPPWPKNCRTRIVAATDVWEDWVDVVPPGAKLINMGRMK